jgi:hypothetical protein
VGIFVSPERVTTLQKTGLAKRDEFWKNVVASARVLDNFAGNVELRNILPRDCAQHGKGLEIACGAQR